MIDPMTYEKKNEVAEAYITRSLYSQKGWTRKCGPNRHLTLEEQLELARLRVEVRLFLLEHPAPHMDNPDMPF